MRWNGCFPIVSCGYSCSAGVLVRGDGVDFSCRGDDSSVFQVDDDGRSLAGSSLALVSTSLLGLLRPLRLLLPRPRPLEPKPCVFHSFSVSLVDEDVVVVLARRLLAPVELEVDDGLMNKTKYHLL